MARTEKWNDKGSHTEPRYFTHSGHFDQDPNHVKKGGFGKGNWGKDGDELEDLINAGEIPPVFKKERRGSNHSQNEERFHKVQMQTLDE
ncbi:hypothetical protein KL918_000395 [Ogataea parapolymorpha]|uniref:ATPase-stabilizing factor protein n=1 Tax=Ogataea parapolymorpha (strain ATCC 26012 / BCRC 20466 / JCM 22074 / NRRL Y-7560 / DL-1) TaxID=871575 RepID=W1Q8Q8_OGAPD|nr:ATPase-stabilizing factor protein [Ogataea parapolymorpha DL-1]ESW96442.1 ATPase-stabilizing factor protein [Ogataea parapolymorpha DL-1]KAG7870191.1 hypothetical protein KL918_000395 [Ogataea parapolymorpha]KAG7875140.1 hypothetical protein KL916_000752 [Ogataea parapolymorpha]